MNQLPFSTLALPDRINSLLDASSEPGADFSGHNEILAVRGTLNGLPAWIATQNSKVAGGTLGAVQTQALLDLCAIVMEEKPTALVLMLESGGVRLHEGNRGMAGLAKVMQQVLAIRRAGIVTVAVIGGRFGCWGGATLISGVCDTTLMVDASRYGLSGPKVLQEMAEASGRVIANKEEIAPLLTAAHRATTGEIQESVEDDVATVRSAVERAIASGGTDPILRAQDALLQSQARMRGATIQTQRISDALPGVKLSMPTENLWHDVFDTCQVNVEIPGVVCGAGNLDEREIPFLGCTSDAAMGPVQGLELLRCALQASRARPSCILLLADAVQAFDLDNERYGYGQMLSALAQVLGHTAATVCPVIGWLRRQRCEHGRIVDVWRELVCASRCADPPLTPQRGCWIRRRSGPSRY